MTAKALKLAAATLAMSCAANAATVERVVARQQWPWSTDVKVVYRTKDFIIVQKLSIKDINGEAQLMSSDTFYRRTQLRDMQYEKIFEFRGKKLNGKRLVANIAVRKLA